MVEVDIRSERIDDLPLLIEQQHKMGIPEVLDMVVQPHGNRDGLSIGKLTAFWLAYILSQADHRMERVEAWANGLQETLSTLASQPVGPQDFTDDRLADVLRRLSNDQIWEAVETQFGQRMIRVYGLEQGPIRVDSTSVSVHQEVEKSSLFQYGHSKDRRPDLPQFKVMLATLDPLGMPLATLVAAGNRADDRLYIPTIKAARTVIGQGGRLYIGDAKMSALAIRGFLQAGGDFYLTPLAQTGEVPGLLANLLTPVWNKEQVLQRVSAPMAEGWAGGEGRPPKLLAVGYETVRPQQAIVEGSLVSWQERIVVVYSPSLAKQLRRNLDERLSRCQHSLLELTPPRGRGQRQWSELEGLQAATEAVLKKHRAEGLLEVSYGREIERREVRQYGGRGARTEEQVRYVVQVKSNDAAIAAARRLLGWRLYVSNAPEQGLGLAQAVWAYRGAPQIERDFRRLKGRPLGIRPLYVQREDHAQGMVRLLSLALRVLTVVEHVVRKGIRDTGEAISGLHPGNPKRQSFRPTTERLLEAFEGITLTVVHMPAGTIRHVTPLSELQRRILSLLGLSPAVYESPNARAGPI